MDRKRIIIRSELWIKWTPLLVWWVLSLPILVFVSADNGLNMLCNEQPGHEPRLRSLYNEIRGLRYTRRDAKENYRPIYSVYFENLRVENNDLGIFKTALHKVAKIQDLKLEFYRHTSPTTALTSASGVYPFGPDAIAGAGTSFSAQVKELLQGLTTPRGVWRIDNIHLTNISEVYVHNFDYKVFCDGDLHFGIQSRRAIISYKWSDIILRGHVTIRTADGSTLEANNVKWNAKKQLFSVHGVYVLSRGGTVTTGKGICVDAQFNAVETQNAKIEGKENKECFAKL